MLKSVQVRPLLPAPKRKAARKCGFSFSFIHYSVFIIHYSLLPATFPDKSEERKEEVALQAKHYKLALSCGVRHSEPFTHVGGFVPFTPFSDKFQFISVQTMTDMI
ncbi:MAG: hypothetical protein PUC33_07790 [Oscillospiraceae bacterium]|nr:hypothetical protein [Oscillospiraceae bacterium]